MSLRQNRLAVAGAFATQGFVFISLTTRLPAFSDRWSLSRGRAVAAAAQLVLLAGVGSLLAERLRAAVGSRGAAARRAARHRGHRPGRDPRADVGRSSSPAVAGYGVALGVVDATTNMQAVALEHRYGAADPAVLPRRLDLRRPGRVRAHAGDRATSTCGWMALRRGRAARGRRRAVPARERAGRRRRRDRRRPVAADPAGRARRWCSSTWSTPRRSPGDRPTSTDVVDAPSGLVALATFPYLLASGLVRLAGDGLVAGTAPVRVLRTGALVASRRPGGRRVRADLAGRRARLHAARRRRRGGRAAELLGGRPDRRRRHLDPADRQARVDAVIARFNQFNYVGAPARRGDDRPGRRRLAARRLRRPDGADPGDPAAGAAFAPALQRRCDARRLDS